MVRRSRSGRSMASLAALLPAVAGIACGGDATNSSASSTAMAGAGSSGNATGAGGAAGSGGTATSSSASAGTGGSTGSGTGAGTGGSGGACANMCDVDAHCTAPDSVCGQVPGDCNACWPVCNGSMCQGTNTCVTNADCNASPDDRCVCDPNGCTMCVLGVTKFVGLLDEGIWLIGWGGGLDHFSWVRFSFQTAAQGTFDLLDLQGPAYTPYFSCQGPGLFTTDSPASTVTLQLPMGCDAGGMPQTETLTFTSFYMTGFPQQATLSASIVTQGMQYLEGYRYPSSICDAAFTMCSDPFQ